MSHLMAVLLDGIAQIEYDRRKPLSSRQSVYLDRMDVQMERGIEMDGRVIERPEIMERARFIASNLVQAIKTNNEALAAAMTTYLAVRMDDLKQVKIRDDDSGTAIEFVFDEDYVKQFPVQFNALKTKDNLPN